MAELTDVIGLSAMMDLSAFNKGMGTYNQGLARMNANTGNAANGITGTFSKMGKGIAIGVMAGVAAMGALAAGALKVGMEFDSAYDTIINRTGATGERLTQLKADANAVFRAMPTQIGVAADAVAILNQRLDLTGTAAQDVAKQLLMTGTGNIAGTTEELSKAMKAWGISTADAAITLDKMKMVSQKTGVPMEKLLGTMSLAAPTMKALGISGDQAIAMMGQLDKAGIEPTIMLTGLRSAMMKFTSGGVTDMAGGLTTLIASIRGATSESAAMSIGMEKFGARAGPMMVQAIRTGAMSTDDLVKAMQNAKGTIESTYMATLDFPEKMMVMKNKVLSAIAPIGESMMGYIGGAFDLLGPYVDKLAVRIATDLVPALDGLVSKLSTLYTNSKTGLAQLAGVLKNVGTFFTVAFGGKVPTMVQTFADGMSQVVPSTTKVVVVALKLRDALFGVGDALQSVRDWLGQLAEGLGIEDRIRGLTSQLTGLWDTVRESFQSGAKGGGVEGGIESLLGLLGLNVDLAGVAGPIGKLADTLWGQVQSAFQGVKQGDVIGAATLPGQLRKTLADGLVTVGQGLTTTLGDMFPDLKPILDTWIMPIWQVLGDVVTMFLDLKAQILPTILEVFGKVDVIGMFTSALAMVRDLIATILPVVVQLAVAIIPLAMQLLPILVGAFTSLLPVIQQLIPPIAQMVVALLPVLATVLGAVGPIVAALVPVLVGLAPVIGEIIGVVGKIIADVLPVAIKVIEQVTAIIVKNMPLIRETITNALDVIKIIWDKVWPLVKDVLAKAMDALGPLVEGALKVINGALTVFKGIFEGDWDKIWKGVQGILDGAWTAIKGVFTALFGDLITVAKEKFENMRTTIAEKVEAVRKAIAEKVEPILKPFKDIWSWIDKNLLPVFRSLAELVKAVVGKAFEIIAATFTNKVLPALKDVWKQIANFLQPAFDAIGKVIKDVGGWITDKLIEPFKSLFAKTTEATKATSGFKDLMDKLKGGLDGIGAALSKVTGFFGGLTKAVNEFEVPEQIKSESPPPLETGLLGIAEAVDLVSRAFKKMASGMNMADAQVFTEVTKSISRVVDSIKELIELVGALGATGPAALPDLSGFMTSYAGFMTSIETAMTGLEAGLGYERIKQLAKLAMRFQEIFAALNIGAFEIKLFDATMVTRWAGDMFVLADSLVGLLVKIDRDIPSGDVQTAMKVSDRVATIVGFVQGAIDAIGALAEYAPVASLTENIANVRDRMLEVLPALITVANSQNRISVDLAASILESAQKIVGFIQPAIDAIASLYDYEAGPGVQLETNVQNFVMDVLSAMDWLKDLSLIDEGVKAAALMLEDTAKIISFIKPAIEGLIALYGYEAGTGIDLETRTQNFVLDVLLAMDWLKDLALIDPAVKAAAALLDDAQKIVGFVKPAIEALVGIYKYESKVGLTAKMQLFAVDLATMLRELITSAGLLDAEGVTAAQGIYESAGKMTAFIGPAITALTAVGGFAPSLTLGANTGAFVAALRAVVSQLVLAANTLSFEGMDAAKGVYASAQGILAVVGPGVTAIKGLLELPVVANIGELAGRFAEQIRAVAQALMEAFAPKKSRTGETVPEWEDIYADAVDTFGSVQSIIAVVSPGIAALKALVEMPSVTTCVQKATEFADKLKGVAQALMDAFAPHKSRTGETVPEWDNIYQQAVETFGSVTALMGVVTPGIAALKALVEYKGGDIGKATAKFTGDLKLAAQALGGLATYFAEIGVPQAEALGNALTIMQGAVTAGLGLITGMNAASVDKNVLTTIKVFAQTVSHWLGEMERTVRGQIANLVQSFTSARSPIITALEAMTKAVSAFGLAMDKLSIPTWLEPGSPPPLAYAMADVRKEVRMLETAYRHIPALESAAGRYAGSRTQTNVVNRSTNLGGIVIQATVNNEVDVQRLGDIVVQRVARAMAM